MSCDSTTSCQTHVDLIGSTLWFVCVHPQTVHCGDWLHFTRHKNTLDETDPSGSLHSLIVSCHWFPLQLGRHPLLWPAGWPLVHFKCSDELSDETLKAVKTVKPQPHRANCTVSVAALHCRCPERKHGGSSVTTDKFHITYFEQTCLLCLYQFLCSIEEETFFLDGWMDDSYEYSSHTSSPWDHFLSCKWHLPYMELGADIEFTMWLFKVKRLKHPSMISNDTCHWPKCFCFFYRLLWVLHQMFRRGAVCVTGGHDPLLLWRCPVLRMWPCGSHWHRHHLGNPLLQGHEWSRHADWCVSFLILHVRTTWLLVTLASVWETNKTKYEVLANCDQSKYCVFDVTVGSITQHAYCENVFLHNHHYKGRPKSKIDNTFNEVDFMKAIFSW